MELEFFLFCPLGLKSHLPAVWIRNNVSVCPLGCVHIACWKTASSRASTIRMATKPGSNQHPLLPPTASYRGRGRQGKAASLPRLADRQPCPALDSKLSPARLLLLQAFCCSAEERLAVSPMFASLLGLIHWGQCFRSQMSDIDTHTMRYIDANTLFITEKFLALRDISYTLWTKACYT